MQKKQLPYVIQYPADFGGCGFWRFLWPQIVLNMRQKAIVCHSQVYIRDFLHYNRANAVHIQRQAKEGQYNFFKKLIHVKKRLKFRLIYESDDALFPEDIPDYNPAKEKIIAESGFAREIIELCDEMTVTTPFLRDYYLKKTGQQKITVIPNYPPLFWIGDYYSEELILRNYRIHKERPRILYAGSASHFNLGLQANDTLDDFSHVKDAIIATADKFKWIFVGGFPKILAPFVQKGMIEYHPWQTIDSYPRFLAKLQINMWIAPLHDSEFNKAKSDLKFLEATALGLPIACQDMCTYAVAPIRFRTGEEMVQKIQETLVTEETFIAASRRARNLLEGRWLEREENIGKYLDIYTLPYGDPSRKYV